MLNTLPDARTPQVIRRVAAILLLILVATRPLAAQTSIATVGLGSGWATFGQAVPQGQASTGLRVGSLATQTDVKNRWPDGSVRFAVVTVNVPTPGTYAITSATSATTPFAPSLPTASVTLTVGSVAYVAALPAAASSDTWLSGPLAYEARSVVTPSAAGAAHPFLRVIFDTRVYSDRKGRVDVTVENVLDKTGATTVTYDVSIVMNGQVVFTKAAVSHYYLTRWRKLFPVGGAAFSTITPDMTPFNVSRAIPKYLSLVANQVSAPTGVTYDILREGALDPNMPAHGGRAELAPYPDWTARYLVHRDPTQRSFVLANGDLSGSWPVHVREAETSTKTGVGAERLVSLDQRPSIWYDGRAESSGFDYVKGRPMPLREYGSVVPGPGQSPLIPDDAHQPSLAYVPYLLTGDRYYAEEMAFWGNYGMLRTYNGDGVRGAQGILAYNEVRGYAWALRNLVEAAAYYPDSPVKTYLSSKVMSNLQWLDALANAQNPTANPFTALWLGKRPDGNSFISMWEQNYLAYAIDRANKLGFAAGLAHRDAIAKFQLRLFNSEPAYPRAQGAPYIVGVGTWGTGTLYYDSFAQFTFHKTMAQVWSATQGNERPFGGYYGPEARLNLMMGVESGWSGAQAAYDYLWPFIGVQPSWGTLPDLAQRAGWALDFYPAEAVVTPVSNPLANIDTPADGGSGSGQFTIAGWAVDLGATAGSGVDSVAVYADPGTPRQAFLGSATYGGARGDVGAAFGTPFANSSFTLNVASLPVGTHMLAVYARSTLSGANNVRTLTYTVQAAAPAMALDEPVNGGTCNQPCQLSGWAVDTGSVSGSGVDAVHVYAFPNGSGAPIFVGVAQYGDARPSVGGIFGPRFTNSGYQLRVRGLAPGSYLLVTYARSTVSGTFNDVKAATVTVRTSPRMSIDLPASNSAVPRRFNVSGWAVDLASASGPGVDAIHVYAFPVATGIPQFLGVASYGVSRPDVGAVFGGSQFNLSGFNLTVNSASPGPNDRPLPPGTYDLAVYAHSTVSGTFDTVRTVRIVVQ